jgi:hypothetical protein
MTENMRDITIMSQYKVNLGFRIWPFERVWVLFLLISSLVACAATTQLAPPTTQLPRVLVLDNCDSDYKIPPFNDAVLLLNMKGEVINQINGLNICQNIGGNRAISVSDDGHFFVVCENVGNKITAYDLMTGNKMWSLPGMFRSAAIAQDVIYVLTSDDKIYGDGILAIDSEGNIIKQSKGIKGFDIVVDPDANSLWLAGRDIKKCNMDLQIVRTIDPITHYAVSIDRGPDGSVWVVERAHIDVKGSQNRLLRISSEGNILQNIPLNLLSPMCVCVNRSDGSVWVTGIYLRIKRKLSFRRWPPSWQRTYKYIGSGTHKYSSRGRLLLEIKRGGHSIDIDPSNGSVWIADRTKLLHYTSGGKKLETCDDVSDDHKWITVAR